MARSRSLHGDKLKRKLLTTLSPEAEVVGILNSNLRATVAQLDAIEMRQRFEEAAQALCRAKAAKKGTRKLSVTLIQRTVREGAQVAVFNPKDGQRHTTTLRTTAVAGDRVIELTDALPNALDDEAPIYVIDGDPVGFQSLIDGLSDSMQELRNEQLGLSSVYQNTVGALRSIKLQLTEQTELNDAAFALLRTQIRQTADTISLQASKTFYDEFDQAIARYHTEILQTAEKIELTADRVTDLEHGLERANTRITQTADSISLFAQKLQTDFFDTEWALMQANFDISAEQIASTVSRLKIIDERVEKASSSIRQTAASIIQTVSWEEFEEIEGSQLFTTLTVATAGGDTTLTVADVPTRLKPGDVLLVRNNDPDLQPWQRQWFEVTIGGANEIPVSSTATALPIPALTSADVAIIGSPVYLRSSLFKSIKTQTAYEISQSVIAAQRASEVTTVANASLVGGASYTSIPVPEGVTTALEFGKVLIIRDDATNRSWVVTVGGPGFTGGDGGANDPWIPNAQGHVIPVVSFDPVNDIPSGTPIWTSTAGLESLIQQFSDEIILQVTSASPFNLGELTQDYTGTPPTTTLATEPLAQAVRAGDTIIHTRASNGYKTSLLVTAPSAQGDTSITIESSAVVAETGDTVSLGQLSRLDIELGGISVDTLVFHSQNWNGLMDPENAGYFEDVPAAVDHGPGTLGWALTRNGDVALNNAWIRGSLQSTDFDGHWNDARTDLEIDTDLPIGQQPGSDVGTTGWALTQLGTAVFTDAKLRGDLDIVAGNDVVKLNTAGLVVGGTVLGATEGLFLPMGENNLYAGNALISWTDTPSTAATSVPRAHIGAHMEGDKITIGISAANAAQTEIYSAIDLEVANGKQFTTGNVKYPTTQAPSAGHIPVTASATSLVWQDINIERVYDIGVWKQGNLLDNETFFEYNAPRNFVVQNVVVNASDWGSPSASINILGQSFNSSAISWTPGSTLTVSSISGAVVGTANGLTDVQVTVKAYWTGEGFDGPTLGAKDAFGSVTAGPVSVSYTVTN